MVHVIKRILIFTLFCCCCSGAIAQQNKKLTLSEALLEVASQHKVSILFNPKKINGKDTQLPKNDWSLEKKVSYLLKGTDYEYKLQDEQIFLYQRHQVYGYIEDGDTGERLISASIYIPETGKYDITNAYGYFTLSTIADSIDIELSYLGYTSVTKTIYEQDMDRPITLVLSADNEIEEVVISDALTVADDRRYIELNQGSDILLFQNQASSAVGGEPDIFQAISRQTGVNTGADGIGGIHVRGGKNDQNQILYDGVRLYNSAHAFGVYSIINNSVIDQARFYKTGANGALSGRLSSIMDVKTKDPKLNILSASTQVSTVATQAMLDIPIIEDKLGVMISGRRTHIDPLIQSLTRQEKLDFDEVGESTFYFDDYSLKAYAKINNKQKLYLSLFSASDNYLDQHEFESFDDEGYYQRDELFELSWSNRLASLRYNVLLGSRTFANLKLSSYQYKYGNFYLFNSKSEIDFGEYLYSRDLLEFTSGITSYDLRFDLETHTDKHAIKYGIVASIKDYLTGTLYLEDGDFTEDTQPLPLPIPTIEIPIGRFKARDITMYASDKFKFNPNVYVDAGIYANHYQSNDDLDIKGARTSFLSLFGYFKATAMINTHWSMGFTVGTYIQNEHLLTTGDNGYPSDIWLPSTDGLDPSRSNQAELFSEYTYKKHRVKTSIYYKLQQGIVIFDTIAVLPSVTVLESDLWKEQTVLVNNRSVGFEFDYSYSVDDKLTFRSMYSYAVSDFVFKYEGEEDFVYPFDYSIPHTINLGVNAKVTSRVRLMLDWTYATGRPYTLYTSPILYTPLEKASDVEVIQVSGFNELRLPSTHKLSIALLGYWYWGKTRSDLSLGIQNVYNRRNILYKYELLDEGERSQQGFPLLPMIRWRVSI